MKSGSIVHNLYSTILSSLSKALTALSLGFLGFLGLDLLDPNSCLDWLASVLETCLLCTLDLIKKRSPFGRLSESREVDCLPLPVKALVAIPDLPLKWCEYLLLSLSVQLTQFLWILGVCLAIDLDLGVLAESRSLKDRLNSLWREFDILTKLPDCTYAARNELSDHAKLLKLMQFLMRLDDIYQPIRSSILTREILPEVMKLISLLNEKSCSTTQANMAGANQHITNSTKNMFDIVDVSELKLTIGHPNGTLAQITHVVSLKLNNDVVLFDVLIVPEYCLSLLSVHKLIKDSKLSVSFDESKCHIQDLKKGRVLGTSSEVSGLYVFDNDYNKCAIVNQSEFLICHVSKDVWHNRLGHPANQVLKLLKGSLNLTHINHESPCEIFHKAKQRRESFPLSENKSKCFGQLIHLDVWGPYKVVSREGFRYFLTIVDDYTRDVKFYETIFPYKMGNSKTGFESDSGFKSNSKVLNLNFFDFVKSDTQPKTSVPSPNDEEEGTSSSREGGMHQPTIESGDSRKDLVHDNHTSQSGYDDLLTLPDTLFRCNPIWGCYNLHTATPIDENTQSEGTVVPLLEVPVLQNNPEIQTKESGLRRSKRSSKLPDKLNDYVLDKNVRYGLSKYSNHHVLSADNYCFVANMNKSSKPSSFEEASKDIN
ncbi:ribonuclease H-like domain-containing protein [Tanacetum coccineum]